EARRLGMRTQVPRKAGGPVAPSRTIAEPLPSTYRNENVREAGWGKKVLCPTRSTGGGRFGYGSCHSTGSTPCSCSDLLVRLKGREPKKPLCADMGLGCVDSTHGTPGINGRMLRASRPHRI